MLWWLCQVHQDHLAGVESQKTGSAKFAVPFPATTWRQLGWSAPEWGSGHADVLFGYGAHPYFYGCYGHAAP